MDGSVDNNSELCNALIFFADEAIGFRKSLHHYHRWLETREQGELEALFLEIGRENFVDLWPILNSIKKDQDREGIMQLAELTKFGLFLPRAWAKQNEVRLTPLKHYPFTLPMRDMYHFSQVVADFKEWINHNTKWYNRTVDPLAVIAYSQQLMADAKTDFKKAFELLEMFFGHGTLASCVLDNDIELFGNAVSTYYAKESEHIKVLAKAMKNHPDLNWKDALSRNQVRSKIWLLEKVKDIQVYKEKRRIGEAEPTTIIVGGWVGLLPYLANMLGIKLGPTYNVDIDTSVHGAATELNYAFNNNFRNSETDIREFNIARFPKPIVIDTIVEHFEDHSRWVKSLPMGTTVILQGNDMFHVPDHVNCHASYEEFIKDTGLNKITWVGELNLDNCTRYMAIGNN